MDNTIKIKENKSFETDSSPRFMLTFKGKSSEEQKRINSYDLLSKLIGSSDVIVELNGTLLNLPSKNRDAYITKFIDEVKALGLEYRCSKATSVSSPSLLNLFGNKTRQEQVTAVYVPNEIWLKPEMKNLISLYGARYLVVKEKLDVTEALDHFQRMDENEQVDYFKLVAFDAICLNAMSIFTNYYDLSSIKAVLGID